MNIRNIGIVLLMATPLLPSHLSAAPGTESDAVQPAITVALGIGQFAIKDEFFSRERYSGTLPQFQAEWQRPSGDHGHRMGISWRSADGISNHSVSTQIIQLRFYRDYLRPPRSLKIASHDATVHVGPGTEFALLINRMNIAADGAELDVSVAAMLSIGANAEFSLPLGSRWLAEANVRSSILSFAFRLMDTEDDEVVPVTLLTPLSGLHGMLRLGVCRRLSRHASARIGYLVDITRIAKWDPVLAVGDFLTFGLSYEY